MKQPVFKTLTLDKIVGGGQTLGQLDYGKKAFVWGGLPGEKVEIQVTKKKSNFLEGIVTDIIEPSAERISPVDGESYLSTSPWQIMTFEEFAYRNKIEFSWWWDKEADQLDLAFFRRGTHGKIPVEGTSLADPVINEAAHAIRDVLRNRSVQAYLLKTVIIRSDQNDNVAMQLYVKDENFTVLSPEEISILGVSGFELIFSNPKSPASVITHRMQASGTTTLTDTILGVPFTYAVEGFFQINVPVYEQALRDMKEWIDASKPSVDLYSGVGTIGLTVGGDNVTMVEINEHAVREMERNITALQREKAAKAILAPSESALEHITGDATIIVDPPRAGLHEDVIDKLLAVTPARIIYLSCNPVTQARDVARLAEKYGIRAHRGYNFFPRTPHIEHLVVLDLK
jgi:23S rRNA (uracil1939-C5)-methyltransferase